jgi:hypothetical protein
MDRLSTIVGASFAAFLVIALRLDRYSSLGPAVPVAAMDFPFTVAAARRRGTA